MAIVTRPSQPLSPFNDNSAALWILDGVTAGRERVAPSTEPLFMKGIPKMNASAVQPEYTLGGEIVTNHISGKHTFVSNAAMLAAIKKARLIVLFSYEAETKNDVDVDAALCRDIDGRLFTIDGTQISPVSLAESVEWHAAKSCDYRWCAQSESDEATNWWFVQIAKALRHD